MKNELVSIIVPIYNVENYLDQCLNSLLNQTYKNIEIICVNDGSKDNSLEILNKYTKNKKIIVINQKNLGLSSARNAGIEISRGKYVYFVDSDDWIEKNTIELLVKKMKSCRVDAVVHCVKVFSDSEKLSSKVEQLQKWFLEKNNFEGLYKISFDIEQILNCTAWNKLYKSSIIQKNKIRFPVGLINEDIAFLWMYFVHCSKYYILAEKLYNYRIRNNSITNSELNFSSIINFLKIYVVIYEYMCRNNISIDFINSLLRNYLLAYNYILNQSSKKYKLLINKEYKKFYKITKKNIILKKQYYKIKYRFVYNIYRLEKKLLKFILKK